MKKVDFIKRSNGSHWVGDGFPVRSIFTYNDIAREMSPFLLMDYAGPTFFDPTESKRGVGEHPHRGFETVTIVYDGEVEHRDSSGGGGKIGPGDVQWMTAASGLVHEEFHGRAYAKRGGPFEMIQLWVNLPAQHKSAKPGYQGITSESIPEVTIGQEGSLARIIAGEFGGKKGPARTFTPMQVWDVRAKAGDRFELPATPGYTTSLFTLKGRIQILGDATEEGTSLETAELAVLERKGDRLSIQAMEDSTLLFLSGEPIEEPIVGHGPFVMNTRQEILQAFVDYQEGRMGRL
jgi:redox-sensitive bicupin YhaK (pirin superfamily)